MQTNGRLNIAFEALADDTRRSIIARLSTQTLPIGRLSAHYKMSRPAVYKHIKVLEKSGFVLRHRKGRQVYVALVPQALIPARKWLGQLEQFWTQSFKRLNKHLIYKS